LSDVSDDNVPVIGQLAKKEKKKSSFPLGVTKMRSGVTGGGGGLCCKLPAAGLFLSLPSALVKVVVNTVSDVGRETGREGMKMGTNFHQPIPRKLEGEIVVMSRSMIFN